MKGFQDSMYCFTHTSPVRLFPNKFILVFRTVDLRAFPRPSNTQNNILPPAAPPYDPLQDRHQQIHSSSDARYVKFLRQDCRRSDSKPQESSSERHIYSSHKPQRPPPPMLLSWPLYLDPRPFLCDVPHLHFVFFLMCLFSVASCEDSSMR
jgi:hypothetical protein